MAALLLLGFAGAYLMLFNPRTQANSYVIVVPTAALAAAWFLLRRRIKAAGIMLFIVLCFAGNALAPVWSELWLKPLGCVAFCGLLLREVFRTPRPDDVRPSPSSESSQR